MKNFKDLLTEARDQASDGKANKQTIILSLVLLGIFLYFIWGDKTSGFLNRSLAASMVIMFTFGGTILVMRLLFSATPIGKVGTKNIRRKFYKLYHEELSRLEESKSDAEKNISLLKDKQANYRSPMNVRAINERLRREEARLIKANDELQLFHQEVGLYVRPTEARPDVTSYIR